MFSSPRTFRDAIASTEQYQRSRAAPEQPRDTMAARENSVENVQRFPSLSSDTASSSPHRHGSQHLYTQACMYRPELQLPSPPLEADFRPQQTSTMSDATQAVKASLAPPISSLQSARPPQFLSGSCEPCPVVEAGHFSKPRLVEHNGQAQVADRTVRRRSLRRPQPLQGLGARNLYASGAPSTPAMTDARSLYGSPGRCSSALGNETSAVPVRTAGPGSSDLSPKRCDSSSPEADARKRGKGRATAEERAASGHIPRPPNSFMLYRSAQNKLLSQLRSQEGDKLQQADLSRMIAQMWQDETPEVRERYAKQAAAEKAEHALKYPGYTYRPKSSGRRKVIKFKQESSSPKGKSNRPLAPPPPPTTTVAAPSVLSSPAPENNSGLPLSPHWPLSPMGSMSYFGSATSDEEPSTSTTTGSDWPGHRSSPPASIDPALTHAPFDHTVYASSVAPIPLSAPAYADSTWDGQAFGFPFPQTVLPSQSYPPSILPDLPWTMQHQPSTYSALFGNDAGVVNANGQSAWQGVTQQYDNALQVSGLLGYDGEYATLDPSCISR